MIFTKQFLLAWVSGLLLACTVNSAALAGAGGIAISPVVLELDSPRKAIAVTVTNSGDRPITLQTDTMTWKQVNGTDQNEPTDDLLVVPTIVTVPANSSQMFRVMLRAPNPSPLERTYRLILEDISEAQPSEQGDQPVVAFKFSHSLPLLIAPSGKIVNAVSWKPCAVANAAASSVKSAGLGKEACVRLLNAGNRRIKVQGLTLAGEGWQQPFSLKTGENILAGAEREWRVPLQPGQAGAVRGVQVQIANAKPLTAETGGF